MNEDAGLERTGPLLRRWKEDHAFKALAGAALSTGATGLFAAYNGLLGVRLLSIWHGGICVFYLLLTVIRGLILLTERNNRTGDEGRRGARRQRTFMVSAAMLLLLNLSLILPISLMVKLEKPVHMGLIPAIAMATYATCKITMASVHICRQRRRGDDNILVAELRTISFIDALVSVLSLQNTLIMVNRTEGEGRGMFLLSAVTSAAIYIVIVLTTVRLLLTGGRRGQ